MIMKNLLVDPTPPALSSSNCADDPSAQRFDTFHMKAEICWENADKRVIRYTFSGVWNWDDFYQILEERNPIALTQDIDVIVDFRAISLAPSDAILHLKRAAKMAEEHNNFIVLISNSATIATLFHAFLMMYKTMGKRIRMVNSDTEAQRVLGMRERE
jgi:hypothetical protein